MVLITMLKPLTQVDKMPVLSELTLAVEVNLFDLRHVLTI